MHILMKTGTSGYDSESICAILEITPALLDWLRVRVNRVHTMAEEFQSHAALTLTLPWPLDVYLAMPEEAARLEDEEGALDPGWMECTTQILDDINGEREALDYQSVQISSSFIAGVPGIRAAARFLEVSFLFRLRHSDQEESTYAISWTDLDALYPQACLDAGQPCSLVL
jgi:hypothetical protein